MIHWTYQALRPCAEAFVLFFWGEAEWGLTQGLQRLRQLRFSIVIIALLSISIVCRTAIEHALAAKSSDSYSYYEGKVLEERMVQAQRKVDAQAEDIRRLLEMANTQTLLAVKMQSQMESQQQIIDAGVKLFGAAVLVPVLAILWGIFKSGLRRERTLIGRRGGNEEHKQ